MGTLATCNFTGGSMMGFSLVRYCFQYCILKCIFPFEQLFAFQCFLQLELMLKKPGLVDDVHGKWIQLKEEIGLVNSGIIAGLSIALSLHLKTC